VALPFWLSNLAAVGVLGLIFAYTKEHAWSYVRRPNGYELPFGLLLAAAWWSVCDAYLPAQAAADAASLTLLVGLFYFLAAGARSKKDFSFLLRTAFGGYVLALLGGLFQYGLAHWHWPLFPGLRFLLEAGALYRVSSVFIARAGTSVFSAFLSLAVPVHVGWFCCELGKKKIKNWRVIAAHLLVIGLGIFNVVFSFSRALLIACLAVFLFSLLKSKYWRQFLAAGIILMALAVLFVAPLQKTIGSLFDANNASNRDHYMLAEISLRQIAQRPLNGWGGGHLNAKLKQENGRWLDLRGRYKTPEELRRGLVYENMQTIQQESLADGVIYVFSPHNMYLGYFVEYGFLGFLGVTLLLLYTYRRLARRRGSLARALLLGLLGFAVYGLFQDSIRAPIMAYLFWFYLLLVVKLEETARQV
jgi:O-antigen ligase